jgi:hypothetical protein
MRLGGRARARSRALSRWLAGLLPVAVGVVCLEILAGEGIGLKSGLTFVAGLLLMGLAAAVVLGPSRARGTAPGAPGARAGGRTGSAPGIALVIAASMVVLLLAKSAAWWTATRGLQNLLAESREDCITWTPSQPFALQWPWMRIIDDWVTPMNALAFRPRLVLDPGRGVEPVPLILRNDGCARLRATGVVHPTDWIARDFQVVDRRFGPLRR